MRTIFTFKARREIEVVADTLQDAARMVRAELHPGEKLVGIPSRAAAVEPATSGALGRYIPHCSHGLSAPHWPCDFKAE